MYEWENGLAKIALSFGPESPVFEREEVWYRTLWQDVDHANNSVQGNAKHDQRHM